MRLHHYVFIVQIIYSIYSIIEFDIYYSIARIVLQIILHVILSIGNAGKNRHIFDQGQKASLILNIKFGINKM